MMIMFFNIEEVIRYGFKTVVTLNIVHSWLCNTYIF